jgi:hypothetical protein
MIFTIQTDDEVAGLDITNALSNAGIKHTIVSKQNDKAAQQLRAGDKCPHCHNGYVSTGVKDFTLTCKACKGTGICA